MSNTETKVWYIMYPNNYAMNYCLGWWNLDEKSLSKWQQSQRRKIYNGNLFFQERQIALGWHLVLVSIRAVYNENSTRQIELVTLDTIFGVVSRFIQFMELHIYEDLDDFCNAKCRVIVAPKHLWSMCLYCFIVHESLIFHLPTHFGLFT